jgi:hypothetical protein
MSILKKLISTAFVGILLAGCMATHTGTMVNSASLSQNNFKIIGNVTGKAETYAVLGIGGGIDRNAIVLEAKQNMQKYCPLKAGQAYANITVDFKNAMYLLLVRQTVCTINADIVQFLEDKYFKPDTSALQINLTVGGSLVKSLTEKNGYYIGQKIDFYGLDGKMRTGRILQLTPDQVCVEYYMNDTSTGDAISKITYIPYAKIKIPEKADDAKDYHGYKLDELVLVKGSDNSIEAKIVVLQPDTVTVEYKDAAGNTKKLTLPYTSIEKKK